MKNNLNIAIFQVDLAWENRDKNLDQFQEQVDRLNDEVDLVVLPEMFTTGFSMNASALAEKMEGKTLQWMQKVAREKNLAVTGSVIIEENGQYYNRLFFVYPDTTYQTYDKRHTFTLAKEDQTYTAGSERLVVEYLGWKICPLICYDLRFPVWARNTEDYDVLIYVANWPETRIHAWDILLQARAIENMSYCIGVNRTGKDGNEYQYNGHSCAYDFLGKNLFSTSREEVFSEIFSLDKSLLNETRNKLKFLQDRDTFNLT